MTHESNEIGAMGALWGGFCNFLGSLRIIAVCACMQVALLKDPSHVLVLDLVTTMLQKVHTICNWPLLFPNAVAQMRLSDIFLFREVGMPILSSICAACTAGN